MVGSGGHTGKAHRVLEKLNVISRDTGHCGYATLHRKVLKL